MTQAEYEASMFSAEYYDALNTMSKIKELQYGTWLNNFMRANNVKVKTNIEKNRTFINYCKEQFEKFLPKGFKGLVSFEEWRDFCDMPLSESCNCLKEGHDFGYIKGNKDQDRINAFDQIWRMYKVDLKDTTEHVCKNEAEADGIYEILKDFDIKVMKNGNHLSY